MALIWILRFIALIIFLGAAALFARAFTKEVVGVMDGGEAHGPTVRRKVLPPLIVALIALLGVFWLGAATYVPATQVAVVENTTTGHFKVIGSGIHVWPFQPDLIPLVSKVTKYNLRQTKIEIGTDKVEGAPQQGIAAGSSSPGNPSVYIQARGWAVPNRERLVELHRRYGPGYADNWVERNWVTAVKAIQGQHPYNYLAGNRDRMANEIEENLQKQLLDADGKPLVNVSQLSITNFDYDLKTQGQLEEVTKKEFERQRAEEDIEIAKQTQLAEQVKAQTRLEVAKKDGEATVAAAQAEAEAIRIKYENEQRAAAYIQKQWIDKWDGKVPQYQMGGQPLIQIPAGG